MPSEHVPAQIRRFLGQVGRATPLWPLAVVVRWSWVFYRELRRDVAFVRAAGMAYATLIALVPSLVLVYGFVRATGLAGSHTEDAFVVLFDRVFGELPAVREVVIPGLLSVDLAALGVVSVVGLVVVAARLYLMVERAYCELFSVPVARPLSVRLLNFYFTLTAVPIALILLMRGTLEVAAGTGVSGLREAAALVLQYGLLVVALKLLPATRVRWRPALIGALASWMLLEGGRRGFGLYLSWFAADDPLRAVYGAAALIPLFLMWLFLIWVFVLLGVEVAYVVQHYDSLIEVELRLLDQRTQLPSVHTALQIALWVAWGFEHGEGATSLDGLVERTSVDGRHVSRVVDVLETGGLLLATEHGWVPARPLADIRLADVVAVWASTGLHDGSDPVVGVVDEALALEGTLADGLARWRPKGPGPMLVERTTAG